MKKMIRRFLLTVLLCVIGGQIFSMEKSLNEPWFTLRLDEKVHKGVKFHHVKFSCCQNIVACVFSEEVYGRRVYSIALFSFNLKRGELIKVFEVHGEVTCLDLYPSKSFIIYSTTTVFGPKVIVCDFRGTTLRRATLNGFTLVGWHQTHEREALFWHEDQEILNTDYFFVPTNPYFEISFPRFGPIVPRRKKVVMQLTYSSSLTGYYYFRSKHPTRPILFFEHDREGTIMAYDLNEKKEVGYFDSFHENFKQLYPESFHPELPLVIHENKYQFEYRLYNSKKGAQIGTIHFKKGEVFGWHPTRPMFFLRNNNGDPCVKVYKIEGLCQDVLDTSKQRFSYLSRTFDQAN